MPRSAIFTDIGGGKEISGWSGFKTDIGGMGAQVIPGSKDGNVTGVGGGGGGAIGVEGRELGEGGAVVLAWFSV